MKDIRKVSKEKNKLPIQVLVHDKSQQVLSCKGLDLTTDSFIIQGPYQANFLFLPGGGPGTAWMYRTEAPCFSGSKCVNRRDFYIKLRSKVKTWNRPSEWKRSSLK